MSLMQLLTVGQSLRETKDATGTYRLPDEKALPRFDGAQPGKWRTAEAEDRLAPSLFEPAARLSPGDAAHADMESDPAKIEVETGSFPVPPPSPRPGAGAFNDASVQRRKWTLKQVLFVRRSQQTVDGRAVQTEWALEKVTVVRNDLNDSDLEIIPARKPALSPKPVQNPSWLFWKRQRDMAGSTWVRWTTRVFGRRHRPI